MEQLKINIKIRCPILTAGVGVSQIGIDINQLKNSAGNPIISGTHIKGRLKFAILQILLAYDDDIYTIPSINIEEKGKRIDFWISRLEIIFGSPDKLPSSIIIDDFALQTGIPFSINHRIAISRDTGTAKEGALVFMEGAKFGQECDWIGTIQLPQNGICELSFEELKSLIIYGFLWFDSIGTQNNIGWGKIIGKKIEKPAFNLDVIVGKIKTINPTINKVEPEYKVNISSEWDSFGIKIELRSPLLIAEHSTKNNFFEGRDDIPGSVIKRAIADYLLLELGKQPGDWINEKLVNAPKGEEYSEIIKEFSSVLIRFAFPINPDIEKIERPFPLPITSFAYKGWQYSENDVPRDILINDLLDNIYLTHIKGNRIEFKCDNNSLNGWRTMDDESIFIPQHFIHTRTAINNFTLASEDAKLFSYKAISNMNNNKQQIYIGEVIFPKSEPLKNQIKNILSKVNTIGKASRHGLGKIEIKEISFEKDNWEVRLSEFNKIIKNDKFLVPIMLVTEAILLEPFNVQLNSDLKQMYEITWKKIFGENIVLKTFYVNHKLRGIRKSRYGVPPVILTNAGSVFLLEIDKKEQNKIKEIFLSGIEVSAYLDSIDKKWNSFCPYRRTNGYGEVIICHPIHLKGVSNG
ncbi:hypothetical protein HY745_14670 [Candidatus Desantisbacteria bacterium]|nr:hypothetical protein [Candidatus Desantisbacteria bacterium]